MTIWIKIGTLPADLLQVVRKRWAPVVGETFYVRERGQEGRPTRVYCDQIKVVVGAPLYFVGR